MPLSTHLQGKFNCLPRSSPFWPLQWIVQLVFAIVTVQVSAREGSTVYLTPLTSGSCWGVQLVAAILVFPGTYRGSLFATHLARKAPVGERPTVCHRLHSSDI